MQKVETLKSLHLHNDEKKNIDLDINSSQVQTINSPIQNEKKIGLDEYLLQHSKSMDLGTSGWFVGGKQLSCNNTPNSSACSSECTTPNIPIRRLDISIPNETKTKKVKSEVQASKKIKPGVKAPEKKPVTLHHSERKEEDDEPCNPHKFLLSYDSSRSNSQESLESYANLAVPVSHSSATELRSKPVDIPVRKNTRKVKYPF